MESDNKHYMMGRHFNNSDSQYSTISLAYIWTNGIVLVSKQQTVEYKIFIFVQVC